MTKEIETERDLFARSTGDDKMRKEIWQNAMTWSATTLLSLSAEQRLKTLIIKGGPTASVAAIHDFEELWHDVPEHHEGVLEEVRAGLDFLHPLNRRRREALEVSRGTLSEWLGRTP